MTRRSILAGLPLALPCILSASGDTIRIAINGHALATPIEITEGASGFEVWSHEPQSLIVNWAGGAIKPPNLEPTYEVSFLTTRPRGPNTYRVLYQIDPATGTGYVYIPGKDTWLITRKVEGQWFHAWSEWEKTAHPLIAKARKAQ